MIEEGGEIPEGLPIPSFGGGILRGEEDAVLVDGAPTSAGEGKSEAGGGGGPVSSSTNLDDLITDAIKDAAGEEGVDYDTGTGVEASSWGSVKSRVKSRSLGR